MLIYQLITKLYMQKALIISSAENTVIFTGAGMISSFGDIFIRLAISHRINAAAAHIREMYDCEYSIKNPGRKTANIAASHEL